MTMLCRNIPFYKETLCTIFVRSYLQFCRMVTIDGKMQIAQTFNLAVILVFVQISVCLTAIRIVQTFVLSPIFDLIDLVNRVTLTNVSVNVSTQDLANATQIALTVLASYQLSLLDHLRNFCVHIIAKSRKVLEFLIGNHGFHLDLSVGTRSANRKLVSCVRS